MLVQTHRYKLFSKHVARLRDERLGLGLQLVYLVFASPALASAATVAMDHDSRSRSN